jgi:hypothetical protein
MCEGHGIHLCEFYMQFGISPNFFFYIYESDCLDSMYSFSLFYHLLLVWPQGCLLVTNDTWWHPNSYGDEV